jgi:hypothetical protein
MDQVESASEEIGDPQEEEIIVVEEAAGVPCDHKDAACDDNREYFDEAVKKEVIVETDQIQSKKDQNPCHEIWISFANRELFHLFLLRTENSMGCIEIGCQFVEL